MVKNPLQKKYLFGLCRSLLIFLGQNQQQHPTMHSGGVNRVPCRLPAPPLLLTIHFPSACLLLSVDTCFVLFAPPPPLQKKYLNLQKSRLKKCFLYFSVCSRESASNVCGILKPFLEVPEKGKHIKCVLFCVLTRLRSVNASNAHMMGIGKLSSC